MNEEQMDAYWGRVGKKREQFWQEFFDRHFKDNSLPDSCIMTLPTEKELAEGVYPDEG